MSSMACMAWTRVAGTPGGAPKTGAGGTEVQPDQAPP
jgi:hypothetical protein